MFAGHEIVDEFDRLGITHVIWIPDTTTGQWEPALESAKSRLIRICREGEAWPLAAGLFVAGKSPIVMMQTTGLFESGDALRNVVYDLEIPIFGFIGARNWLSSTSNDSAKRFAVPILDAWQVDYVVIESEKDKPNFAEHFLACKKAMRSGFVVLAE